MKIRELHEGYRAATAAYLAAVDAGASEAVLEAVFAVCQREALASDAFWAEAEAEFFAMVPAAGNA